MKRSFGTHDGSFHADEVTACSLLFVFDQIDLDKVVRSRDSQKLSPCDYVCDVGGEYDPKKRRFDHHQADYKGPMSSAGMVLLHLKEEGIISPHRYDQLYRTLVMGVDAHDNGTARLEVGTTTFSQIVSNFMPIEYEASDEEMNTAFFTAVDFVVSHLKRLLARIEYTEKSKSLVERAMAATTGHLFFDESVPWMENFFEMGGEYHPAEFVVMPSGRSWKLRGIPPTFSDRMRVRRPHPEKWAGLQDEALKKASGIPGAIFCHKGRFISIWETKEDAFRALRLVQQEG